MQIPPQNELYYGIGEKSESLAYGLSAGKLNRPIRIQRAGKILVSWYKASKSVKAFKSGTFLTWDGVRYPRKGIFNFKNRTSWQKLKSINHFVFLNFYFGAKNTRHGNSLVVRRVSQGRIIIVLFWTKYAVPRQIKPGILKLTTSRGQRLIFVSCEEKGCYVGCYRILLLGHQNFDCRSYCGLSCRMQGINAKKNRYHLLILEKRKYRAQTINNRYWLICWLIPRTC